MEIYEQNLYFRPKFKCLVSDCGYPQNPAEKMSKLFEIKILSF